MIEQFTVQAQKSDGRESRAPDADDAGKRTGLAVVHRFGK